MSSNSSRNSTAYEQPITDALLGITAIICCFICLLVLVALSVCARCYSRSTVCGTVLKRLAVGFTVLTMLFQLFVALHLVRYFNPEVKHLCELQGFLIQYASSVNVLLVLGICLVLFFEALTVTTCWKLEFYKKLKWSTFACCDRKINKLEVIIYTLVLALTALLKIFAGFALSLTKIPLTRIPLTKIPLNIRHTKQDCGKKYGYQLHF